MIIMMMSIMLVWRAKLFSKLHLLQTSSSLRGKPTLPVFYDDQDYIDSVGLLVCLFGGFVVCSSVCLFVYIVNLQTRSSLGGKPTLPVFFDDHDDMILLVW